MNMMSCIGHFTRRNSMSEEGNLSQIVTTLQDLFNIQCHDPLTLGNVCKTVYRATSQHRALVIKIGLGERPAHEVRLNRDGYRVLRSIGAGRLLPDPAVYLEIHGTPILVMEDCGPDFLHHVQASNDPVGLYQRLVDEVHDVYLETRCSDSPQPAVAKTQRLLVDQCRKHLQGLVDSRLVDRVEDASTDSFADVQSCFSTFDFTPEDVFLTEHGIKHADPLPDALGIPVIDLACFAGVARDAHRLPGSNEGYEIMERYALQVLPNLINLSPSDAQRLFSLGRALQSALSCRFRLHGDRERALVLAGMCEAHMRDYLR